MEEVFVQMGGKKDHLLPAVNDDHGGVIVDLKEPMDQYSFGSRLTASLFHWKLQVFLTGTSAIPILCASFIRMKSCRIILDFVYVHKA